MDLRLPSSDELGRLAGELQLAAERGVEDTRAWLASPTGRRYRALAAQSLIVSAPFILRHRFFRTPFGRLVEVAGGIALVAKVADLIRDWEPEAPGTPGTG